MSLGTQQSIESYSGTSALTKPTSGVQTGATFFETDTLALWVYNGSSWQITPCVVTSGSGKSITGIKKGASVAAGFTPTSNGEYELHGTLKIGSYSAGSAGIGVSYVYGSAAQSAAALEYMPLSGSNGLVSSAAKAAGNFKIVSATIHASGGQKIIVEYSNSNASNVLSLEYQLIRVQ